MSDLENKKSPVVITIARDFGAEPTRRTPISYAVFCLKKKKKTKKKKKNKKKKKKHIITLNISNMYTKILNIHQRKTKQICEKNKE